MTEKLMLPEGYASKLDVRQTEVAIKALKDFFERELAEQLNLTRVSAPLFVRPESGLNDNLNGIERPVSFDIIEQQGLICEIVQSLAKWKRMALGHYGFNPGEGLYTDMNAIRRDEYTDNIHSLYVDQWDWEKIILKEERTVETLEETVRRIYGVLLAAESFIGCRYPYIERMLPPEITFITAAELEAKYPGLNPHEREKAAAKEHGAIFLMGIGGKLPSGAPHDGRAPDYDDWSMNGDIIVYYPLLDIGLELSSMGVRVDETALAAQLEERGLGERLKLDFHRSLMEGRLPYTIGGGIGQSRLCMFFLRKAHIGEVQASVWPDDVAEACERSGISLL